MSKPWMLLQRRNADALASATITKSAPAYVAPTLKTFRIYGVYGEVPIAVDGAESMLAGGAVIFYIEFNNPDGLPITKLSSDTDPSWERTYMLDPESDVWWNQLTQLGKGYLWQLSYWSAGSLAPNFSFDYEDPDGGSHTVGPATCSNGPLTVSNFSLTVSPEGWIWINDLVTIGGTPEALITDVNVTQWEV